MASLRDSLPQPSRASDARVARAPPPAAVPDRRAAGVPPYGKRGGGRFQPDDFADGGAYPEVHQAQYPPGFGPKGATKSGGVQVTMNASGETNYDAIVTAGRDPTRTTHTGHGELVAKPDATFERPSEDAIQAALDKTKASLLGRIDKRAGKTSLTAGAEGSAPEYIKYTPSNRSDAHASGASHRLIKMHQAPSDPLEPPKFRHKKVPRGPGSPPVPVMHSPPRSVDAKEQADWKIPPSISNWKNPKGYTIPLDKRLAADGRGLQEVQINDNFARLSEALYLAEQKAREAVETRARIQHEILSNEKAAKEDELRELAQRARVERVGGPDVESRPRLDRGDAAARDEMLDVSGFQGTERTRDGASSFSPRDRETFSDGDDEERRRRDEIREERRRERERERRRDEGDGRAGKRSKLARDRDRDVSEQIALGQSNVAAGAAGEHAYDQRLFDREAGIGSGFHGDDAYDVYDKPLFNDKGGGIYKPTADADGAARDAGRASGPVEFQRHGGGGGGGVGGGGGGGEDPFGLDAFLDEVKRG